MVLYLETLAKVLFKIIHFSSFFLKFFTMAIPKEVLEGMRHSQIFGYIFHQCLELGLDPIWRQSDHLQTFFSSNQILRIRKFDNGERVLLRPLCTFACILNRNRDQNINVQFGGIQNYFGRSLHQLQCRFPSWRQEQQFTLERQRPRRCGLGKLQNNFG